VIAAAVALISSVGGGLYFVEDRYLTEKTGVPREEAVTRDTLQMAMETTQDYLLNLRIEQAEMRRQLLEREATQGHMSPEEQNAQRQRELNRIDKELDRLYEQRDRGR